MQGERVVVEIVQTTESDSDERTAIVTIFIGERNGCVVETMFGCGNGEMSEAPHLLEFLPRKVFFRDKPFHLSSESNSVLRDIEKRDRSNARFASEHGTPGFGRTDTVWRDKSDSSDDDAFHSVDVPVVHLGLEVACCAFRPKRVHGWW
jgi:hypothetical protein